MISGLPTSIDDGVVRLREITPEDSERLYRWRMDPRSRPMFRHTGTVSLEAHRKFLDRYFELENDDLWFVIETLAGEPVGTIALYDRSEDGRTYEWGRLVVDPDGRGRGYARRAFQCLIRYGRRIGLASILSEVLADNEPTIHLHHALGFRVEQEREHDGRRFVLFRLDLDSLAGESR